MNKRAKIIPSLCVFMLLLAWAGPGPLRSAAKTYWHFTLLTNINGTAAQEWLWATMVELPKETVFADEALLAEGMGGKLEGTIFGQVRAAAWRSEYTYYFDTKCKGRKSKKEIAYSQSQSDSVFVHGQIIRPRDPAHDMEFRWGVCNHRVLMEDGRWRELGEMGHVFVGPIRIEGREPEEMRGEFGIDGIIYDDQTRRVKRCGESWIEDFDSVFKHFESHSLRDSFEPGGRELLGQRFWKFHGLDVQCVYLVIRSPERAHPYWKQRRMS